MNLRDLCPRKAEAPLFKSHPSRSPIYATAVYECESPDHAREVLSGEGKGYAYQRDGNPNSDILAEKIRLLHDADRTIVTSSGQGALTTAIFSQLSPGDHILLSNRLYGGTTTLIQQEMSALGFESSEVDMCEVAQVKEATRANTKMLILETMSNPTLRVAPLETLAELAHANEALLVVDNTFATPIVCQPFRFGADMVLESLTKFMNGHGDVILGALAAREGLWERIPNVVSRWGFTASPFDCWLAERGLETLFVRMEAAAQTAFELSQKLQAISSGIERIDYPGLPSHLDIETITSQFARNRAGETLFGNMITLHLAGGSKRANSFIESCSAIPYCPSLGETQTTLSHPASSSHRNLSEADLESLGMSSGTIRLSIGLESSEFILDAIMKAL